MGLPRNHRSPDSRSPSAEGSFYAVDPIMSLFMSKEFSVPKSFSSLIMNQITNVFTSHDQTVSE